MGIHIVLYQPEIPANTGNIARTCAGTDTKLHLIRPLGFSTEDKMLRRAGLDYWKFVQVTYYDTIDEFFHENKQGKFFYITKFGEKNYANFDYSNKEVDHFFIFGRETTGLPKELVETNKESCLRIPMNDKIRALNLSNAAAVLIYEALRQQDYPNIK